MKRIRLGLVVLAAGVASSCYRSHELGDGADAGGADADGRGTDGGPLPVRDECGALVVTVTSGCSDVTLPPSGTASCVFPGFPAVTGPSFVVHAPSGARYSVATFDGTSAQALASDACDVCSLGHTVESHCGSRGCAWSPDPVPVRVVLQSVPDGAPFHVRVCTPPEL